jgi:hypothetical protein
MNGWCRGRWWGRCGVVNFLSLILVGAKRVQDILKGNRNWLEHGLNG